MPENLEHLRAPATERLSAWLLAAAIVLAAANLRPAVSSVGPVLGDIRVELGLSGAAASLLTALPILCFGIGALLVPWLAQLFGAERTLVTVFGAMTVGLVLRMGTPKVMLFAGTFLAGAAIAVANVLLPALIKRDFGRRIGLMMGLYVSVMMITAAVAAGVTVSVASVFRDDWRAGLGVWAVPAALAFVLWLAVAARSRRSPVAERTHHMLLRPIRDPVAWQVTVFLSLHSLGFYSLISWLPSVYRSAGLSAETAGQLLSLMIAVAVPAALFLPTILTRSRRQSLWGVGTVLLLAGGLLGVLIAPAAFPYVWATLIGAGMCAAFPLALTLVVLRTRDARDAAQLSAMSQSMGYLVAAAGPVVFGVLHDLSNGWTVPLLFILILLVPQAIAGYGAGRHVYVRVSDASS